MTHDTCLQRAVLELEAARQLNEDELRDYPTPLSGCDAQYSHLIGPRGSITDALTSGNISAKPGACAARDAIRAPSDGRSIW